MEEKVLRRLAKKYKLHRRLIMALAKKGIIKDDTCPNTNIILAAFNAARCMPAAARLFTSHLSKKQRAALMETDHIQSLVERWVFSRFLNHFRLCRQSKLPLAEKPRLPMWIVRQDLRFRFNITAENMSSHLRKRIPQLRRAAFDRARREQAAGIPPAPPSARPSAPVQRTVEEEGDTSWD